jgi:hypothetical protein
MPTTIISLTDEENRKIQVIKASKNISNKHDILKLAIIEFIDREFQYVNKI